MQHHYAAERENGGTCCKRTTSDTVAPVLRDLLELVGYGILAIVGVILAIGAIAFVFYGLLSL
jgi:hypothetical protein